jgi:hypothetical protein
MKKGETMNYSMTVNKDKSPLGINLRSGAGVSFADIGDLSVVQIAEGDNIVIDSQNQQWLNVLMIDGVQTSVPTYAAVWLCDLITNPPAPVYPPYTLSLSFSADAKIEVKYKDTAGVVTVLGSFPNGTVEISAENPTLQLT